MRAFRSPGMEQMIEAMGLETFFEKSFGGHVDLSAIPDEEKKAYLDDWSRRGALTPLLNWYRASNIEVQAVGVDAEPPLWTREPSPRLSIPVLVLWGMTIGRAHA